MQVFQRLMVIQITLENNPDFTLCCTFKSFIWLALVILTNNIPSPQGVSERKWWTSQKSITGEEHIMISTLQSSVY